MDRKTGVRKTKERRTTSEKKKDKGKQNKGGEKQFRCRSKGRIKGGKGVTATWEVITRGPRTTKKMQRRNETTYGSQKKGVESGVILLTWKKNAKTPRLVPAGQGKAGKTPQEIMQHLDRVISQLQKITNEVMVMKNEAQRGGKG